MASLNDDFDDGSSSSTAAPVWWMGFLIASAAQVQMVLDAREAMRHPGAPSGIDEFAVAAWFVGFLLAAIGFSISDVEARGSGRRWYDRVRPSGRPNACAYGFFGWLLTMSGGLMVAAMALLVDGAATAISLAAVLSGLASPVVGVVAFALGYRRPPRVAREEIKIPDPTQRLHGPPIGTHARFALLDRDGRSQEAWRSDLRGLLTAESYRHQSITREDLLRVLEDPRSPAQRRVAAAMALADTPDATVAIRARAAVDNAEERVRVVLTGALDGALDDDALADALADERSAQRRA